MFFKKLIAYSRVILWLFGLFLTFIRDTILNYNYYERFKKSIYLQGNFAPVHDEIVCKVSVNGEIPSNLPSGMFARNGPNPQFAPSRLPYHWFTGDGMIHAIQITRENNTPTLTYTNKFIQTEKYLVEKDFGAPILGGFADLMNPFNKLARFYTKYVEGAKAIPDGSVANTSIKVHAGKTFALVESSPATQIKLPSLETIGSFNFNGAVNQSFTAHPIIDPKTQEMVFFGYKLIPDPYVKYGIIDKNGKLIHHYAFKELPWATMHHSFACTQNYVIFMFWPLVFDGKLIATGHSNPYTFDKQRSSRIAVCPKYMKDEGEITWFDADSRYCFHIGNAFEKDNGIIELNLCAAEYLDLQLSEEYKPRWRRYEFNLNTKKLNEQDLLFKDTAKGLDAEAEVIHCEFPVINDDYATLEQRYSWACRVIPNSIAMQSIIKFDFQEMTFTEYKLGDSKQCGEWVFIKSTDGKAEDEGYLMTFVYNANTNTSDFVIINAKTMDPNSIVKASMPRRVPFGFHGIYVTEEQMC